MATSESRLEEIFCRIMAIDVAQVAPEKSRDQLSYWKSLKHISLIVEVEKSFKISIPSAEAIGIDSYAKLLSTIKEKLGEDETTPDESLSAPKEASPDRSGAHANANVHAQSNSASAEVAAAQSPKKRGFFSRLFGEG